MENQPATHTGDVIYYMAPRAHWVQRSPAGLYAADTLVDEGFTHCTAELDRLLWVANRFYRQTSGDWVILVVDPAAIQAEICWEEADGHIFPHIYGAIDAAAVRSVFPFPRECDGGFCLPLELSDKCI